MRKLLWLSLGLCPLFLGQAGCNDFRDCSAVDISGVETLPSLLSQTGLYANINNDTIADEALFFEPQHVLWTDGAKKRRWIIIPENAHINTQNESSWDFPVGTKLFKEFSRDGKQVETRLNTRTEQGWIGAAYLWNADGTDAVRQVDAVQNARGTAHDVPSASQCLACHGGRKSYVLGFSATQLDTNARRNLYDAGLLTAPSTADVDLPEKVKKGLGYLHANCSHCHNPGRNDNALSADCFNPEPEAEFNLSLPPDLSSLADAPILLTGRNELMDGEVMERISQRNQSLDEPSMPPLGTELTHSEGMEAIQALIDEIVASGL